MPDQLPTSSASLWASPGWFKSHNNNV